MKKKEKATWGRGRKELSEIWAEWRERERESCFLVKKKAFSLFLLFYYKLCHMSSFEWSKRAHFFLLMWLILSHKREENMTFATLKSCLGLHAVSLVPVPRVSLRLSGPVFESRQYIYQNAQNKTLSVVQRFVLLNFKSHTKRWFLD